MRKTLSLLTILFIVTSCLVFASAQTRRKRNININRGVTRTRVHSEARSAPAVLEPTLAIDVVVTSPGTANASGCRKEARGGFMKESKTLRCGSRLQTQIGRKIEVKKGLALREAFSH
jgi:hypothetical protein